MKLVIYDPKEQPKEFAVNSMKEVEGRVQRAKYGDSVWVLFRDDGTVDAGGVCDQMRASHYEEDDYAEEHD